MSDQEKSHETREKVVFKTPPRVAFTMGILAGVTVTSLVAFIMSYSLLRTSIKDNLSNSDSTAKVAGAATNQGATNPTPTDTTPPTSAKVDIQVKSDDHIRGDKNAQVVMVEYSDFQCPFCSRVKPTIDKLLSDYQGKVKLVYRHFPLTNIHENAQKAAEASECAHEQGKFWEMHDKMFADQNNLGVDSLKSMAKDLGLNTSKFNSCLDSGQYTQKVNADLAEGTQYGVNGTPATFVNGILVSGAQPYESFKSVIDSVLAGA